MSDLTPALPFSEWLAAHRQGALNDELTAAMRDIVQGVLDHEKTGTLTLKLKVEPNGGNVTVVIDDVQVKLPTAARPKAIYFAGDGGELHRNDPYQRPLPLHEEGTT